MDGLLFIAKLKMEVTKNAIQSHHQSAMLMMLLIEILLTQKEELDEYLNH